MYQLASVLSLSTLHDNQTGFLDYVDIAAAGGTPMPTATPGPTSPPIDGVTVGTVVTVVGTTSITGTDATGQLAVSTAIALVCSLFTPSFSTPLRMDRIGRCRRTVSRTLRIGLTVPL